MLAVLTILCLLLAAFDCVITEKRIRKYGVQVELNAGIRWLATKLGAPMGSYIGVLLPAVAFIAVCISFRAPSVLALMVGFRGRAFFNQVESVIFEKQITEFAKSLHKEDK
jgi:hypothetical protein